MTCADCGASTNFASADGVFRCWRCHCRWLAARGRARLRCLVLGHNEECLVESHRIVLRCTTCGHESPGWRLYTDPPSDESKG